MESLSLAPFDWEPKSKDEFDRVLFTLRVRNVAHAYYSSHSHGVLDKKNGLAYRLMVFVNAPIPPDQWLRVWKGLQDTFGFAADPVTKNACRLLFHHSAHPDRADLAHRDVFGGQPFDWTTLPQLPPAPAPKLTPASDAGELEGAELENATAKALRKIQNTKKKHPGQFTAGSEGGVGRNGGVFKAAACGKDFGLSPDQTLDLLKENAEELFDPPPTETEWAEYAVTVSNAFEHSENAPGAVLEEERHTQERAKELGLVKPEERMVTDAPDPDAGKVPAPREVRSTTLQDSYGVREFYFTPEGSWPASRLALLFYPVLKAHFTTHRPEGSERVIYRLTDRREAVPVSDPTILNEAIARSLSEPHGIHVLPSTTAKAVGQWMETHAGLIEEPGLISLEPPTPEAPLVLSRPDVPLAEGSTPAWEEFLCRLTDRDAFLAWVWTVFESKARSRQYLWLQGVGQDGKSVVANVIAELIGRTVVGVLSDKEFTEAGQRWTMKKLLGKALALYPDCRKPKAPQTDLFRNITGGDWVDIEKKGVDSLGVGLVRARLFVHSNFLPELDAYEASSSRCLVIGVKRAADEARDPAWKERLAGEMGAFLHLCRKTYQRLCPTHGDVPANEAVQLRVASLQGDGSAEFEEILGRGVLVKDGCVSAAKWKDWAEGVWGVRNATSEKMRALKDYAEAKYGIRDVRHSDKTNRKLYYVGISESAAKKCPDGIEVVGGRVLAIDWTPAGPGFWSRVFKVAEASA